MTDVEASVSTLKQRIVSGARAAGDVLESALPNEWEYTGLISAILTVVNIELGVLETEGKLRGRSGPPSLTSLRPSDDGDTPATLRDDPSNGAAQASAQGNPKLPRSKRKGKTALGRNVDRLRKECGWTFDDLATATDLDRTSVLGHVNKGRGARPSTLTAYADAFTEKLGRPVTVVELESDSNQTPPR
jgi:hypothetical protein